MIKSEFGLSANEEIFDDFTCTLRTQSTMAEKNTMTNLVGSRIGGLIDHRGRMFLTENHLCFSSNIIGIKTKFKIRFTDIQSITKNKTLGMFDWGIKIKAATGA